MHPIDGPWTYTEEEELLKLHGLKPVPRLDGAYMFEDAGFTLAEIGRLLAAWGRGGQDWGRLAERKTAELDARIADAQRAKKLINHALECPHRDLLACPNFRSAIEAQLERPGTQHR